MSRKERASDESSVIHVSEFFETCSTRDRAKRFYHRLLERLEAAPSWDEIVLSFRDVDFVAPSFLDETLLRLAEEHPELARRLVVTHHSEFTARRLRSILEHRNLSWTLQAQDTEGQYRLA